MEEKGGSCKNSGVFYVKVKWKGFGSEFKLRLIKDGKVKLVFEGKW